MPPMHNADFLPQERLLALGFAYLGKNVRLHSTCVLVGCDKISIDDDARIDPFCIISASELVEIGAYSHIAANVALMGASGISIASFCGVSHGARILSASDDFKAGALLGPQIPDEFRSVRTGRVIIERHGCVGANSVVLPGTKINEGATVGALSLVRGELSPWTVYGGIPAQPVGERDQVGTLDAERRFLASRRRA